MEAATNCTSLQRVERCVRLQRGWWAWCCRTRCLSDRTRSVACMDIREIEMAIMQKEEDMKAWCPSSGENVGRMTPSTGDDWWIECPTCGRTWAGGSTVLADHDRYR